MTFSGAQPQLAAAGSEVFVVFGRPDSIQVARSTDAADTFGQPVTLPVSGKIALGRRRGPRVAATRHAVLVSAVIGQRGGGGDGDILLYRSTDQGKDVERAHPDQRRNLVHGSARLRVTVGSVCECCHPSVAISEQGAVAVMFRNNVDGHRDMFVGESAEGATFAPARKLGTGSWAVAACPMDGGSLTLAGGLTTVWRRDDGIFLSSARVAERRLATGRDPAVGAAGSHMDIAWAEDEGTVWVRVIQR